MVDESIQAARSLTAELRPPVLYEGGLVPALRWLADHMHAQHGLTVTIHADAPAQPADEGHLALLFECVRELLFNVVKHAGVTEAKVTVSGARPSYLGITVEDRGVGFGPIQPRADKQDGRGGFGLFSIAERLTAMGGEFTLDSRPDAGTCATLWAPLDREIAPVVEPDGRGRADTTRETPSGHGLQQRPQRVRVLLVDDHRIVREGIAGILETDPRIHIAGQATDGEEAIQMAQALQPDVIVMDINLPRLSGIEATRIIRQRWPEIQVVGLSVLDEGATAQSMRESGAAAYLNKAGDPGALAETVIRVAQHRRPVPSA